MLLYVILQIIVIIIEILFFGQYSLLGVVPSLSVLVLVMAGSKLQNMQILILGIGSGAILDILRPAYSPWFTIYYLCAALLIIGIQSWFENVHRLFILVLLLVIKYILFMSLYFAKVEIIPSIVSLCIDFLVLSIVYILSVRKISPQGSFYETSS